MLQKVLDRGGAVESITWMKREIEEAAYRELKRIEAGDQVVVGVNKFAVETEEPTEVLQARPGDRAATGRQARTIRAERDNAAVKEALEDVRAAAKGTDNMLPA